MVSKTDADLIQKSQNVVPTAGVAILEKNYISLHSNYSVDKKASSPRTIANINIGQV